MSRVKPEIQGLSFVLVGDFNPTIFHPLWFSHHELIGEHEGGAAKIEVVHNDISVFDLDWMRLQVTRDRFELTTLQEPYFEVIRDLVIGTFQLLEHTPVKALGINHQLHFKMKDADEWHGLGHRLAPKECWNKVLEKPGMQKVSIKGERTDGYKGNILVTVEPSSKLKYGTYFAINDHYEADTTAGKSGVKYLVNIIKENWTQSMDRSYNITQTVLEG